MTAPIIPQAPPAPRNVAAENAERAGLIYDKARQSGVSDETAREMARDLSDPRPTRAKLSGDWPNMPGPSEDSIGKYTGPPPQVDSPLWLRKLAWTLCHPIAWQVFTQQGLPIITNCRVRLDDSLPGGVREKTGWWTDGFLRLDLENRHVGGKREYTTCLVPVTACLAHDTRWVIRKILAHISGPNVRKVETAILRETDLFHVHGG